jgi:DNA-binding Xre family transcriptional regulator
MTVNELIDKIATRARELGDMKLHELRYIHPDNISENKTSTIKDSRGECIEAIIVEEFCYDLDVDLDD